MNEYKFNYILSSLFMYLFIYFRCSLEFHLHIIRLICAKMYDLVGKSAYFYAYDATVISNSRLGPGRSIPDASFFSRLPTQKDCDFENSSALYS